MRVSPDQPLPVSTGSVECAPLVHGSVRIHGPYGFQLDVAPATDPQTAHAAGCWAWLSRQVGEQIVDTDLGMTLAAGVDPTGSAEWFGSSGSSDRNHGLRLEHDLLRCPEQRLLV